MAPMATGNAKPLLPKDVTYATDAYSAAKDADAVVIVTEWNEFRNPDFDLLKSGLRQPVIFDGRNIFEPEKMKELDFTHYSIGRKPVLGGAEG